ncbi:MAG: NAD(+)/NADH kinase [Candidatus Hadarchaeales archaeon]
MKVGLIVKTEIPGSVELAKRVISMLPKDGVILDGKIAKKLGKKPGRRCEFREADAVVTIGGDGTALLAQSIAPNVPHLGINIGERGFLAEVSPNDAAKAIRLLKSGKLEIGKRERLSCSVMGRKVSDALNDVVVVSAEPGKAVTLRAEVDGREVFEVKGDGMLISTPTGSTAYAYAAGGPVLDPRVPAFVLVPICPSFPRVSPVVVPMSSTVEITVKGHGRKAWVIVDGRRVHCAGPRDRIRLNRSGTPALFFRWEEFYRKVREKLR